MHFAEPEDKTTLLQPKDITKLQKTIGEMIYYARAVDGTIMTTHKKLAYTQTNSTHAIMRVTKKLMDYCHTHSDALI